MRSGPADSQESLASVALSQDGDTWLDILDQMPVAVVVAEVPSGKFIFVNNKAEEILGHPTIEVAGAGDYAHYGGVHDDGRPYEAHEYPLARAVLDGEVVERELLRYIRGDGRLAILEFNASRVRGPYGQPVAVCTYQDVTKEHQARRALIEAAERVDLALDAGAIVGTWVWNLIDDYATADERFAHAFGLDPERCRIGVDRLDVFAAVHPDDRADLEGAIEKAVTEGGLYRHQYRLLDRQSGGFRWVESSGRVETDASGKAVRFPGVMVDVTAWKQAEDVRNLLMREVDHRSRNALAMVQSVVRLSDAADPTRYRDEVIGRVDAMARAQGSLSRSNWEGSALEDLVREELSSYASNAQFTLTGPKISLPAEHVQPLSMILHEMATNAMKYGALSVAGGTIEISFIGDRGQDRALTWRESGGPAVKPPTREGFGSRLIKRLAVQVGGSAEMDWQSAGLVARLTWRC